MSFAIIVFITLAILVFQVVIAFIKNYKTRLSAKHLRDFKRKFSSNECKSIRIDRNLAFSRAEQSTRSLCLIFGWFVAKRKHLNNYRNVYLNRGFDVLIIRTHFMDPIIPSLGSQITAQNVVDVLRTVGHHYEHVITHTFSAGCYQLGEVLVMMNKNENISVAEYYAKALKGSVFDSPVLYKDVPENMAKIMTKNKCARIVVRNLMLLYMAIFRFSVTKHYKNSMSAVLEHPTGRPLLDFLSPDDSFLNYNKILTFAEGFRQRGVDMTVKSWPNSPHVGHYTKHPEEYCQTLDVFIKKCLDSNNNNNK